MYTISSEYSVSFGGHDAQLTLQKIIGILPIIARRDLFPNGKNLWQCRETFLTINCFVGFSPIGPLAP